ncbi:MAG: ABC transporter permease [Chloroflexi bacterium]|nr:ABC transporter permease [Chloroflexota bacterium]MDA1003525.1 ABC transporter permease [Chloroflexota bacterium]MQC27861.1 ABC transporter permease [Chloroflexota bacterium]
MTAYVVRRLAWLPIVLFVVSFLSFAIMRFGPGDPVTVAAGQYRDPEVLARIRAEKGLDDSLVIQYARWVSAALRGDFGDSILQRTFTVSELMFPKMWVSAQLGVIALAIVFVVGVPLGLIAARLNGTWIDPFIVSSLLFLQAIPVLVLIPPLLWLFALQFRILPVGGWGGLIDIYWVGGVVALPIPDPHLYLPLLAYTLGGFAGVARLVRITALEVTREDYIRTARAKGLSEATVFFRHILRNSLLPIVTSVGLALASVVEGAFFVETLLGIPGIGSFLFEASRSRDYDTIMATTVIIAFVFVLTNLIVELTYGFIDPRVRVQASR